MIKISRDRENLPESSDAENALDFIDLHTAQYQPMMNPGIVFQNSRTLSDGSLMKAEFWRYTSADIQQGGKCDLDTSDASPSVDVLRRLAATLLQKGEIHMITGSSDDTLSIRIFLERKENKNAAASSIAVDAVTDELRSTLSRE